MAFISTKRMGSLLLAAALAAAGCSGEDGVAGPQGPSGPSGPVGPTGPSGPGGENAYFTDIESCAGCHNGSLAATHALAGGDEVEVKLQHWNAAGAPVLVDLDGNPATPNVQAPAVTVDATTFDVTVRFNVRTNGVPRFDFLWKAQDVRAHNEDAWWVWDAAQRAGVRTKIPSANWSFVHNGNGNYTATLSAAANGWTALPADGTAYMLSIMGPDYATATAVAYYNARVNDVVGDAACINCHGNHVWRGAAHDVTNPQGVGPCIVCHNRVGSADPRLPGAGSGLMGIVHGVHNSHNMPDHTYTFTWTNGNQFNFSIGFPGYMNNCSTCHDSPARLAAVMASTWSYGLCISCHDGFASFPGAPTSGAMNHLAFTTAQTCTGCHGAATVADAHNGQKTERNGLIWDGQDVSVVEGAKFELAVTGVTRVGTNYEVTWTARYDGAAVDPCNTDFAVGPVFLGVTADAATGKSGSNMQFVKAYGQGDDWVNADRTGNVSPGQPATSSTLSSSNTTCAANVATSTIPVDTFVAAGTKGTMALQGKPQLRFAPAATTDGEFIQARAKSPTFNFVVPAADGAATAAAARRTIVDTDKCLACHKGTLYQHGGNRVDSVDLCVTCHNPAASETNVRVAYGVTADEAYDGKPGESYDMRNMIHGIHSAGEGRAIVIYRSRGIYFFGSQAALDEAIASKNWPTTGGVTCTNSEGAQVTYYPIYGSAPRTGEREPIAGTGGACDTTTGPAATAAWQIHNVIIVHYPRALNDCGACHADGWKPAAVDPTKGVAMTVDAGADPWGNQLDDVLMGPTTASCLSCHHSLDPAVQFGLDVHAYGQGWIPATFENGRQTLIDAATP